MDKETLSNYGWITIAILVLSVMIALSTPFGNYIKAAVWNTTTALIETTNKSMNIIENETQTDNNTSGEEIDNKGETEPDIDFGDNTTDSTQGGTPETVPDDEEEPFSPL